MDDLLGSSPSPPKESQAISPSDSVTDCPKLSPVDSTDLSPAEAAGIAEQDRKKGNKAFRSGDYAEAIDYYSRSIDKSPCLKAHTNRALAYLKQNMYAKALEDCNQALEITPADPKGLYHKACALEGLGELVEAKSCLKSVLVSEPSNKQVNELLFSVEKKISQKKKQKNEKTVPYVILEVDSDQGKKDGVSSGQADTSQGKDTTSSTADKSGNTPGSETFSEPKPENQNTSKNMQQSEKRVTPTATHVDGSKRESEASSTERTPVVEPPVVEPPVPEGVERLRQEGNDYYKKGQYSESVRMYTSSLDMLDPAPAAGSPSHAAVYCSVLANRAAGWLKVGNCRRCIEDASTVLGLQPDNLRAMTRRAEAYEIMEKYPEALGDYEALVRMAPGVDNIRNAASRIRITLSSIHGPKWRSVIGSNPQSNTSTGTLAASGSGILKTSGPQTSDVSTKMKAQTTTSDVSTKKSQPSPVLQTPPVSNSESSPLTGSPPSSVPVPECRHEPQTDQPSRLESGKTSEAQTAKISPSEESSPSPPLSQVQEATDSGTNQTSDAQSKLSSETKAQQTSSSAAARESNKPAQTVFEEFRLKGNALVKSGDYERALQCYSQCIKASPSTSIGYTNRALCFLKLNRPGLAEKDCTIVLEVDSEAINVKALYRRALARKALHRYSQAIEDLHGLLKIDCKNTAAQSEMDAVKELRRKWLELKSSQRSALTRVAEKAEAAMSINSDYLQAQIRVKLYSVPNLIVSLLEQSHGNWDEFDKSVNRIIRSVADYMANKAPAIIHLHPQTLQGLLKVGLYQNVFETRCTSGYADPLQLMTDRLRWENFAYCKAYENHPAKDRPKYGTLSVVNDPRGMKLCVKRYGCVYLQLKNDIRFRMTFSDKDTSSPDVTVVDCDPRHMMLLMRSLSPEVLKEMLLIVSGEKLAGDSSVIACYQEIQVHGLINLRTDVEKIVLDVRSFKKAKKAHGKKITGSLTKVKKVLQAIKKEYGIPYKLIEPEK